METKKVIYLIREGSDSVSAVLPGGNFGFGSTIEKAQFNAAFFPVPEAAAPTEAKGWRQLPEDKVKVFSEAGA